MFLKIWIFVIYGRDDLLSCDDVCLLRSHLLLLGNLLLNWGLLRHVALRYHWLLLHLRHGSWLLLHLRVVLSVSALVHLRLILEVVLSWISTSVLVLVLRLLSLHDLEKLLDNLSQVTLVVQHGKWLSDVVLGSIVFPISLILDFFKLEISDFLDLVMVNNKLLSFIGVSRKSLFSL